MGGIKDYPQLMDQILSICHQSLAPTS